MVAQEGKGVTFARQNCAAGFLLQILSTLFLKFSEKYFRKGSLLDSPEEGTVKVEISKTLII